MSERPQIIVVGGGAGGLELVTALGDKLGRRKKADITLIDTSRTHVWKPLLHEVAAGTLDSHEDELEYLAQARWHHFRFRLGRMVGLDREKQEVLLAATHNEDGNVIVPERRFRYDMLVIAVGSLSNDFGIPGVKEHCLFLDTTAQAERFQRRLLDCMLRAHTQGEPVRPGQLDVAIVGAGATGVELAAQLHHVTRQLSAFGLDTIDPERHIKLHVIEASPRILPALPPRLSAAATADLARLGVVVHTNERVVEVTDDGIRTATGHFIPAAFRVWAAGIKAPDFLRDLAGLETNRINQLVVRPTLQTTRDDNIYAIGDCAACAIDEAGNTVPPRAQAAHQMASLVAKSILRRLRGKALPTYRYTDYGSLVTLGKYSTVGSLMGGLTGSLMVTGFIARVVYLSLYKMHQVALHGWTRTALLTLAHFLRRAVNPEIKLH
ncbi:NAD(P)/FAD-dependent oxidoreductase [Sulfurivermis fontis]|uniref:NAD(P)/FAD-dependent oxidoreductase n=1 Tax=Sulfurivermis fontis TaxID=1972068 RepID=UPI000FD98C57|nr:NAD(P)/FAD-dependent oxidoreductase [Sulfurivermis fontis]